jgi:hypothetical protein
MKSKFEDLGDIIVGVMGQLPVPFPWRKRSRGRSTGKWTEACKGLPAPKFNVPLGRRTMGGAPMCRTPPLRTMPRHHRGIRHIDSWPEGCGATAEVPLRILRGSALANCTSASYLRLRSAIFSAERPLSPRSEISSRAPFVCRGGVIMIADLIFEDHPPP